MNELKVFENAEFGQIRGVEIDGESWLVGKDVAERLGYANTKDALSAHLTKMISASCKSRKSRPLKITFRSRHWRLILFGQTSRTEA